MSGISIITPVFNRLELLKETAASILSLLDNNWEWILVDDGSDTEVLMYMTELSNYSDKIVLVHRESDKKGAPSCRNKGAGVSKYPFLLFLDSDDLLSPHSVQIRMDVIAQHPNQDFWVFPVGLFKSKPHDLLRFQNVCDERNDLDRFCFGENVWQTLGVVWNKDFFFRIGAFNEQLPSFQDWELSIRSLIFTSDYFYQSVLIPDAFYRITEGDSISNKRYDEKNAVANLEMILEMFLLLRNCGKLTEIRRISLLNFYLSRMKYWEFIETKLDRFYMKKIYFHKLMNSGFIKNNKESEIIASYFFFNPGFFQRLFTFWKKHRVKLEKSKSSSIYFKRGHIGLIKYYRLTTE